MKLSDRLFEEGVFAQGIAFPTVARDRARVRTIVTATQHARGTAVCPGQVQAGGDGTRPDLGASYPHMPAPGRAKSFLDEYTRDLTSQDFQRLFTRDTAEAYRYFTRNVDTRTLDALPWYKRWPAKTRLVFMGFAKDTLEIHRDALYEDDVVLLHDDLLASGGTALAVIKLLQNFSIRRRLPY